MITDDLRATVVGGPIELRDYDYLELAQQHTAVLPDGSTVDLPPGSKLLRHGGGSGMLQPKGLASKGSARDYPPSGQS